MIKLRTEIERIPLPRQIDRGEGIMLLGSCFTDHIGQWLQESWLPVMCNPYGVLFNPASIGQTLLRLLSDDYYRPVLHEQNGRYYSFDHHGKWSGEDREMLQRQLIALEAEARSFLQSSTHLIITLGSSWVYERQGHVVANCHKFPASEFLRRRLSVEEIVAQWKKVIAAYQGQITFTVSPIRHIKDTLHGNQLSKSTLLLAIDELQRLFPDKVQYLPVYELLIDDLRDYRFYADDLVHPSSMAIEVVKVLFSECAMSAGLRQYMKEAEPIVKALQHRPSDPSSPQYLSFLAEMQQRKEKLIEQYRHQN